ncbi:hypothetical protein K0M31_004396 [Melipona bicolor]|uniref:Uncharacterized protein n=1 Tax=Melipona bicolor TaxID=60889 RepID=A0AA40FWQ4_9HYME|nr:hypothetical protein K0M31_004396 [Melipona bicolor]
MWYVKSWLSVYARPVHANEVDQTLGQEADPVLHYRGVAAYMNNEKPETTLRTSARVVAGPSKAPPPNDRLEKKVQSSATSSGQKNEGMSFAFTTEVYRERRNSTTGGGRNGGDQKDVQTESGSAWAQNRAPGSLVDILPLPGLQHYPCLGSCTENTLVPRQRKEILRNRPPIVSGSSAFGVGFDVVFFVARHVTASLI